MTLISGIKKDNIAILVGDGRTSDENLNPILEDFRKIHEYNRFALGIAGDGDSLIEITNILSNIKFKDDFSKFQNSLLTAAKSVFTKKKKCIHLMWCGVDIKEELQMRYCKSDENFEIKTCENYIHLGSSIKIAEKMLDENKLENFENIYLYFESMYKKISEEDQTINKNIDIVIINKNKNIESYFKNRNYVHRKKPTLTKVYIRNK